MKKQMFISLVVGSFLPVAAMAEPVFTGTVTAGYGSTNIKAFGFSQRVNTPSLKFDSNLAINDQFDVGLSLGLAKADIKGSGFKLDITNVSIAPRYKFGNGYSMGVYFDQVSGGLSAFPITLKAKSFGLTAGYEMANWDIEGFIGGTNYNTALVVDLKSTDMGVRANYAVSDQLHIGGHLAHSKIKVAGVPLSVKGTSIGIEGDYQIGNGLSAFGGLSQQRGSIGGLGSAKMNTGSLGVGYTIAGTSGGNMGPIMLSLEAAKSNISAVGTSVAKATTWKFGVTVPIGAAKSGTPLNSHARSINNGNRHIAQSLVGTLF